MYHSNELIKQSPVRYLAHNMCSVDERNWTTTVPVQYLWFTKDES